ASTRPPQGRVIVLAEDDAAVRRMLVAMLEDLGQIIACEDGEDALVRIAALPQPPDLVLTDLMMPKMDGLQLVKRLKADASLQHVPVIMLTAKGRAPDMVAGINAGARHYLTKPFKRDELRTKVRRVLRVA
ncbi:MAG: response regulator, partial [Myxococcota bacterium]